VGLWRVTSKGAEMELAPHAAALGIKFYRGNMFPSYYKNSALIAEHGK
jgi:glucose/arabinose dehydrogenase